MPCASSLLLTISPHLFDQQAWPGPQWFTLTYLRQAFTGGTAIAITNSLWVSGAAAALGLAIGFPIAWLANRTTLPGRRFVAGSMWLVLLLPSWLPALGWVRIVQADGVMYRLGLHWPWMTHLIMGPFGVVLLLGLRSVPFTYLAITAGLAGLGQEFEDAARVHGAGRAATLRLIWPMLAPAIWSALAIGFAEADQRLRRRRDARLRLELLAGDLPALCRHQQLPAELPGSLSDGRAARRSGGHPACAAGTGAARPVLPVLSGRTRQAVRRELSRRGKAAALAGLGLFYVIALGVPGFGAVSASLLGDFGGSFNLTLVNYRALFHQADQFGPLERSLGYGAISASVTVVGGFIAAWLLAQRRQKSLPGARLPAAGRGRAAERRVRGRLHLRLQPAVPVPARHQPLPDRDAAGHRLYRVQPADQRQGAGRRGLPAAAVAPGRGADAWRRRAMAWAGASCRSCPGRSRWPGC